MLNSIYRFVAGPLNIGAWWLGGPLLIALMLALPTWAQDAVAGRPVESAGKGRVAVNGGTVRIEGRVERAIHAPLDLTFRVIASGPTGSWDPVSIYPDGGGRFELFVPEGTPHVSFAIDGEYEVGLGGSWWSAKEPNPVVLNSGLKTKVRLRSVRSDGTPVEGVRFAYPPQRGYQRRWSIPGVSDGQGLATVWLDARWASGVTDGAGNTIWTANFHGVSPGGLVAAVAVEFGKSQEEGNAQTVVFQKPARVRLTFRKLYEQGEGGAFPVEWRGWPALLAGEHELSPVQELSVGDWEASDPEGFARGKYDFAIIPGVEHHLRFVTAEDWHWKHELPALQPGDLHVLDPVVLDPGAVVRGKVVDGKGRPVAGARIRGLCGWNPAKPHWMDTFTLADLNYAFRSNREQEARQKAHRETTSDAQGCFYIRTHERLLTVPLEVTVGLEDSQSEVGATRQTYPAVPADGFEQVLAFAPESKTLRGRVLNSNGAPIEEFQIRVVARGYEAELEYTEWYTKDRAKDWEEVERIHRMGSLSSQMTTDQDDGVILGPPFSPPSAFQFHGAGGRFEIGGYPPGEYNISVVADGYAERGLQAVDLPAEESLVVTLDPSSSIALRAEDFDGTPHGAFEVEVTGPMERVSGGYSLPLPVARTAMTSEDGTIRFDELESGTYKFKAVHSSFSSNASSRKNLFLDPLIVEVEPCEQKKLTWSSFERGALTGKFDWVGAPLNVLIEVDWKRRKGSSPSAQVYSPGFKATVEADHFEVPDVRVGQYELKFVDALTRQDLTYVLPPIRVEVPAGSATDLEIQPVQPFRMVKGQVCIHGEPVITGFLRLESPESGLESTHIKLEGDGRFEVPLPESSRFTARLWAQLEKRSRDRWYVGSMEFSSGEGKPDSLTLNFVSPTLQLNFVDEDGDALPVHESEAANFSLTRVSPGFTYRTGRSGKSEGEDVVFAHLAPGRYELLKRDSKAQFFWEPLPGSILTVTEQPIRQKQTVVLKHW